MISSAPVPLLRWGRSRAEGPPARRELDGSRSKAAGNGAKRIRVLHVLPFPGVGGTEIATRRIADGVRGFGVESRALLLRPTDPQTSYLREAGIPCTVAQPRPEPSFRRGARFLRESWGLARACRDVDLVHCADIPAAYHVAVAGRLAGVPVLCHVRNRHPVLSRRDRCFINATTHFAFVSRDTRARLSLPVPDARASVVYDGIDVAAEGELAAREATAREVRAELGLPPDTVMAAMFARLAPQKDYETLVRAAVLLRPQERHLRFVVVGDHAGNPENRRHYAHVRQLIAEAGVEDRFLFTGFRKDTRRLMLAADICLLSTHFEGLPLVVLEAMALARPCVATAVDGIPEIVDQGATGLLYDHGDAAALAACLVRLLHEPGLAGAIAARARETVRRRFGRERFAREMYQLYARLTGRGDGAAGAAA